MGGDAFTFELFGLTFNATNVLSGLLVCLLTFFILFGLSRHLQMKPTGGQNVIEWLVEFTNGIVRSHGTGGQLQLLSLCAVRLLVHCKPTGADSPSRLEWSRTNQESYG